jgi:DNA-binding response OmpR family regulator
MKPSKPIVLCIEPDTTGVYVRKMVLQEAGYEVLVATDTALAKKLLSSTHVHAVLVDLGTMRTSDSLVSSLKQLNPHVPIIVLSPYEWLPAELSNDVDAVHAQLAPPAELLAKLEKVID